MNSHTLYLPSGASLRLGPSLAGATGEGTVYGVDGRPDLAAKVFHAGLKGLGDKLDKVAAMIECSASAGCGAGRRVRGAGLAARPPLDGTTPVGFVMPRIDTATAVELHTVSNPSNRMDPMPSAPQWTRHATWEHLLNTAANLCLAVESVHRVQAVIGDFQERNILVADTTRVTLVDCDSMQFIDRAAADSFAPSVAPNSLRPSWRG